MIVNYEERKKHAIEIAVTTEIAHQFSPVEIFVDASGAHIHYRVCMICGKEFAERRVCIGEASRRT